MVYRDNSRFRIIITFGFAIVFCLLLLFYTNDFENTALTLTRTAMNINVSQPKQWTYKCVRGMCEKSREGNISSLKTCSMTCGSNAQLWPIPSNIHVLEKKYLTFSVNQLRLQSNAVDPALSLLQEAFSIFVENLGASSKTAQTEIKSFVVNVNMSDSKKTTLLLSTAENYSLAIREAQGVVMASISADNFFGARHGLETLSQLIWWDDAAHSLNVLSEVNITDSPKYSYRGILVDTARNYFPVDKLKQVLVGMAANKLNAFHWHISDSQSFPFDAPSVPEMAIYGAYSSEMVYTADDVKNIVSFAKVRGIRVIIEVDAPSHVNFGWNWGPDRYLGELTLSCGDRIDHLLNPNNKNTLKVLRNIYEDLLSLQTNTELFHIGGDEIDYSCTSGSNFSPSEEFWAKYVSRMAKLLQSTRIKAENVILWSSGLTSPYLLDRYFDKKKIIVQFWLGEPNDLLQAGYRVIFSQVSNWYLDCGFGKWRENKDPACGRYKQWQDVYVYRPWEMYQAPPGSVVGGEVCLWTEQVDVDTLEPRLWPRAAAFAERIWSDPPVGFTIPRDIYLRLSAQRERLTRKGIGSEAIWPQRCFQNPQLCP